jgi:hypothetical protein
MFEHHHHHHPDPDAARTAVLLWASGATISTFAGDQAYAVTVDGYTFATSPTPEAAWVSAFDQMAEVNAYYLWLAAGEPLDASLEFWLDGLGNIEDGPPTATTPPTE